MNFSNEYNDLLLNHTSALRNFGMRGSFFNIRCCSFIVSIYPHLESFEYIYSYKMANTYDSRYLQLPFYDMITQLASLKRLSLRSLPYKSALSQFWPEYLFIQFLNNHPNQLISLSYPSCLYRIAWTFNTIGNRPHYDNGNNNAIVSNGLFLNHVTALSMSSKELIKTVSNFLIHNMNALTISKSISKLVIHDNNRNNNNGLYLSDWLVLFPELEVLKLENQVLVEASNNRGGDGLTNQYINNNSSSIALHQLISRRKHVVNYNQAGSFNLKTLELDQVAIKCVNWEALFANTRKLNRLVLKHIHYFHVGWLGTDDLSETITSISLDISHLRLNYMLINDLRIYSWENMSNYIERLVKRIQVLELSTGKTDVCFYNIPLGGSDQYYRDLSWCHPNSTFVFNLFCDYIDQLVFY